MSNSNSGVGAGAPDEAKEDKKNANAEENSPAKDDFLQEKRETLADEGLAHGSMNAGQPMERKEYSQTEREGDHTTDPKDNVAPAVADSPAEKANGPDARK